ncbi:MAG: hypothetical protein AAF288_08375 [Planctomycetota bacterium]
MIRQYPVACLAIFLAVGLQLVATGSEATRQLARKAGVQQIAGVSTGDKWPTATRTWPFLNYPMYSRSYGPPVQADSRAIYADLPNGEQVQVTPEDMGMSFFAHDWAAFRLLDDPAKQTNPEKVQLVEHNRDQAAQQVVDGVRAVHGQTPTAIWVEITTQKLEPDGAITKTVERIAAPVALGDAPTAPPAELPAAPAEAAP